MTATSYANIAWTVPLAGFANPRYVAANPLDDTGFEIGSYAAYSFAFDSNSAVPTIVHEQTMDASGQTGWFPVVGKIVNSVSAQLSSGLQSLGAGYVIPQIGRRARMRVTGLTTADLVARIMLLSYWLDLGAGNGVVLGSGTALAGSMSLNASSTVGAGMVSAKVKAEASINATVVKAAAGRLFGYAFHNNTASAKFVKFFAKATAPAPAADSALLLFTVIVPANGQAVWSGTIGKAVATGISYCITGAIGETDTTAVAVDDVTGHIDYI